MKYKRIVATGYGSTDVLKLVEDDLPEPQPGEVRVRVLTAGVAFGEVSRRLGPPPGFPPPPYTPGYDVVGIVDKLSEQVDSLKVGQRVVGFALSPDFTMGGYAEYCCLPAWRFVPVPEGVDSAEAVCLVCNYITAYQVMHREAKVKAGERVLIHGAAGGVGTALLQLGKLAGLEMYGTASAGKHAILREYGATPIDYRSEDFVTRIRELTGDGVDVVFDPIGGDYAERSYSVLRENGRLIVFGLYSMNPADFMDKLMPEIERIQAISNSNRQPGKTAVVYGVDIDGKPDQYREDLTLLLKWLAEGKIKPVIAEKLPLEQAAHAQDLLEKAAVAGKIVLVMDSA